MAYDNDQEDTYEGEVIYMTERAVLFEIDGEEIWFPLSVCALSSDETEIYVPRWLARERGLI